MTQSQLVFILVGLVAVLLFFLILSEIKRRNSFKIQDNSHSGDVHHGQVNALLQAQAEMQGRLAALTELLGRGQSALDKSLNERIDGLSAHLGQSLKNQTQTTHETLNRLSERLAVIDRAQSSIQKLASEVVTLQSIFTDKQTRGAFGQGRMEAIIVDQLPPSSYQFQPTLSNGMRPDCVIFLPHGAPALVIDAKFPLEAWNGMRDATQADTLSAAEQRFRRDMETHINDIARKYLIAGETQDLAFLFIPSESIFASIHEKFASLVQKASRARIIIVSPSLLLLSVQLVQSLLRDARMRDEAHRIQEEVAKLMVDLARLDDRVRKLKSHFDLTEKDINEILISTGKMARRGARIETLELGGDNQNAESRPVNTIVSALTHE